mmetsp:Transcript_70668/g.133335  ORF Transcript_70668/g.133335 Transcript_70668/m.133335 type:complete len:850 (+) Transcript_70668:42-2591(+)
MSIASQAHQRAISHQRAMSLYASEAQPGVIELEVFNMLDTNEDGHLSFEEMKPLLATQDRMDAVHAHLTRCRNPEAGLSPREFAAAFHEDPKVWMMYHQCAEAKEVSSQSEPEPGQNPEQGTTPQLESRTPRGLKNHPLKKAAQGNEHTLAKEVLSSLNLGNEEHWPSLSANQSAGHKEGASQPAAAQVCSGVAEAHTAEAASSSSYWEPRIRSRRGSRPKEELAQERANAAEMAASIAATPKKTEKERREEAKTPRTRASVDGAPMAKTPQRENRRKSTGTEGWCPMSPSLRTSASQDAPFAKTPQRGRHRNADHHRGDWYSPQAHPQAVGAASSWTSATAARAATASAALAWDTAETQRQTLSRCRSGLAVHWEQPSSQQSGSFSGSSSRPTSHPPSHRSSRAGSPVSMPPVAMELPVGLQASASHMPVRSMQVSSAPLSTMPVGSMPVGSTVNMQAMHMMAPSVMRSASVPAMPQAMPTMPGSPMQMPPGLAPMAPFAAASSMAPGLAPAASVRAPPVGPPQPLPQPGQMPQLFPQAMQHAVHQAPSPQMQQTQYSTAAMMPQRCEAGPTAQPALQVDAELHKKLEKAEADNAHLRAENLSLQHAVSHLRTAATPEVIEALKQKTSMPGVPTAIYVNQGLQQPWSAAALRDIHAGAAAPLFQKARRNSRYLIIDPRTGEEVSAPKIRKQPEDEVVRESRPSICEVFDIVDDDQVTEVADEENRSPSPRRRPAHTQAITSSTANQTLGGLILEHTFGLAWDWPLSRQEKKERVLMINQCQLISEIQEANEELQALKWKIAEAEYGGLCFTPRQSQGGGRSVREDEEKDEEEDEDEDGLEARSDDQAR